MSCFTFPPVPFFRCNYLFVSICKLHGKKLFQDILCLCRDFYMNIQPTTTNQILLRKKPKTHQSAQDYLTVPLKQDTFEHSQKEFNLNDSIKSLSKIKDKSGKEKFHRGQLATLEYYLQEEPKKWDSVYTLAKNPEMKADFVYLMAAKPLEHLNTLTEISEIKDKNGNSKYSGKEMMNFNDNLTFEQLQNAKPLTKTFLPVKNIILLAQTPKIPSTDKIADKVIQMEEVIGNKLQSVEFTKNKYEKNAYVITAKTTDNTAKKVLLNKDLKNEAIEDTTSYKAKSGKEYIIKKTTDYRNNTVSKVRYREDAQVGRPVFENEIRIVKDNNNKVKHYEYVSPSVVNGVYDIVYKKPDGTEKIVSSGKIDKKTGITSVKKDMKSPDGTRTQYLYENDPQGNRIVDYKITDKNGNVLMNKSQTFEIINENKFISSRNNDKYEINVTENSISVQDLNNKNKKAIFNADKDFTGDKKVLLETLKHFPGEELIKMRVNVDTLESIPDPLDAYYNGGNRAIYTGNDPFLLLHELGHAVDMKDVDGKSNDAYENTFYKSITADKDVNKTFEEEKANFFKKYPEAQREYIDYFMNTLNHYNGETGGLQETIAESNALLSEGKSYEPLAIRSQYLQQNFPKTIAVLETKLNK